MVVVNIYAPCDLAGKRLMWDDLKQMRASKPPGIWCFMGDFNSIRNQDERFSLSQSRADPLSISEFNSWIAEMELQEIKCVGSTYTWIRPNARVKSRLDRFLVSDQWLLSWPDSTHYTLPRDFSDHCPIILQTKKVDWGPKPFRVADWWLHQKGYQRVVREAWRADQQPGWGGFLLKNKLRMLKLSIKQWSKEFGNISSKEIHRIQQKLNAVEDIAATRPLSEEEIKNRHSLQQQLWEVSTAYESLLRQKSRSRWLQEGDNNTAYFHKVINSRRNYNSIQGILIEGRWVQQPEEVKAEAVKFFLMRFSEQNCYRPTLDGVQFPSLSHSQRQDLILPFTDEELKEAVWSCGGDKCPGPDGFNFNFIKHFWGVMKPEFRRFVDEFHYADDTVFVGEANWDNVVVLKALLRGFEMVSGLRINYTKSQSTWVYGRQSGWWRDLRKLYHHEGQNIFQQCMRWKVGCGDKAYFWKDKWTGEDYTLQQKYNQMFLINEQQADLISKMGSFDQDRWSWNFKWRRNLFDYESVQAVNFMEEVNSMHIQRSVKDVMVWKADPSGVYTTKSAYNLLITPSSPALDRRTSQLLWNMKIPPKHAVFTWKLLRGRLPTRANLSRRGVNIQDTTCPLCGDVQEEVGHLFFNCEKIVGLWWESMSWIQAKGPLAVSPVDHFLQFCDGFGANKPFEPQKVMEDAMFSIWSWLKARQKVTGPRGGGYRDIFIDGFVPPSTSVAPIFPCYENTSEWDDFGEVINPDDYVIKDEDMDQTAMHWLADMEIDDIPCVGKPFTWVRPNGSCKSKLDRVLVSDAWLSKWPDSSQLNLERNYSDHCPILLTSKCSDWGPKPFRVFDAWLSNKDYTKVVRDCWSENQPLGWGGYALKCKLQNLKHRLKSWSRDICRDLGSKVKQTQKKLNDLEDSLTAHPSEQDI
ncbi:Cleavage and polyadenylation specificity factor subunit 2 [Glycine soja]